MKKIYQRYSKKNTSDFNNLKSKEISKRVCKKCNLEKAYEEFRPKSYTCMLCHNEEAKVRYRNKTKTDQDFYRDAHLLRTYGLTSQDVLDRVEIQKGCKNCGSQEPNGKWWCVDYDPDTKSIRGVLCTRCNVGLNALRHDINILRNAIKYLQDTSSWERITPIPIPKNLSKLKGYNIEDLVKHAQEKKLKIVSSKKEALDLNKAANSRKANSWIKRRKEKVKCL